MPHSASRTESILTWLLIYFKLSTASKGVADEWVRLLPAIMKHNCDCWYDGFVFEKDGSRNWESVSTIQAEPEDSAMLHADIHLRYFGTNCNLRFKSHAGKAKPLSYEMAVFLKVILSKWVVVSDMNHELWSVTLDCIEWLHWKGIKRLEAWKTECKDWLKHFSFKKGGWQLVRREMHARALLVFFLMMM